MLCVYRIIYNHDISRVYNINHESSEAEELDNPAELPPWKQFTKTDQLRLGHGQVITSNCFPLEVITHPCPNFNGGFAKPPLKLGIGWVSTSYSCAGMRLFIVALTSMLVPVKSPLWAPALHISSSHMAESLMNDSGNSSPGMNTRILNWISR